MDYTGLEIAIIGISCRFPGAENKEQFWNNLLNGHESVTFFTDEELLKSGVSIEQINNPNYVKANNVLKDSKCFDASFFGYTPNEALLMDPQSRVFHETVWNALEDAGYVPDEYKGRIGLYSGSSPNFLWEGKVYLSGKGEQFGHFGSLQLCDKDFMPTRISYSLDLRGPSMAVYTACSTSLVSVHLACRSLLNGDCNMAVAGGVTIFDKPNQGYLFQEGMIYSPDGHCRAFDKDAAGTLGGEGAGAVVLKRLQNAINDNDPIYAIIKSTAINNDGRRKAGYTAPGSNGQADVIKLAHSLAKIKAEDISFIETHGTGTNIGDPIEIEGLRKAFNTSKTGYCAIGALKTNIGHLDSASGVAGLIKTALVLKNKKIPPTLHFKEANPNLGLGESPFYINTDVIELKSSNEAPAIAGVSSFGIGGTNAHAVLQEYNNHESVSSLKPLHLILLSAKSPSALHNKIKQLHEYLLNNEKTSIADIAFTLQSGRASMPYQTQFICSDANDLKEKLITYSLEPKKISISKNRMEIGSLIFTFSGQGSQYINMGIGLYTHEVVFKKELDNCFDILKQITNIEFKDILYPQNDINEAVNKINEFTYTSPIKFSFDYSLAKYMMSIGVIPKAMVGHSFGEYTVACLAGVMSLQDALELVVLRGRLMHSLPDGAMLSVPLSASDIIERLNDKLSLAAVNSTSQCIVSGASDHIKAFKNTLEKEGIDSVILRVPRAGHSYMVDAILDEFEQKVQTIKFNSPQMPYVSSLTGNWIGTDEVKSSKYWTRHLRETVRFDDATTELLKLDNPIFIQVGSDRSLESFIRQNKSGSELVNILSLIKHPKDEIDEYYFFLERLGKLWTLNVKVDWTGYYNDEKRSRLNLPAYPFDRHKYDISYDIAQRSGQSIESLVDDEGFGADENYDTLLLDSEYIAPTDQTEQHLAEIWCKLLGYKKIGINDNFFELGGDSLKATLMSGEIFKRFNTRLSIKTIIKGATIRQIAVNIKGQKHDIYSNIKITERCEYYELSSAQRRLFFLQQLFPESTVYNIPQAFIIKGRVDLEKIQFIFSSLVKRHDSFRTRLIMLNDTPVQIVERDCDFKISTRQISEDNITSELLKEIKPFKLDQAPLLRVSLLQLSENEYILFIDGHHIIGDGFSNSILYGEFLKLLQHNDLPVLKLQYKDFAIWQNSNIYKEMRDDQRKFWVDRLNNIPILNLPYDYKRANIQTNAGERIYFKIDKDVYELLKKIEITKSFTLFNICISAYYILLYKLSGQDDIIVGTSVFGRNHPDFEKIIGMFVNTIPLRNFPSGDKVLLSFIEEVQENNMNYFDNQEYQYEDLVSELVSGYDTNRNPLFDVFFSFLVGGPNDNYETNSELKISNYEMPKTTSMFDLTLSGQTAGEELVFFIEYSKELFSKESIETYIIYYKKILSTIACNVEMNIANISIYDKMYWVNRLREDFKKTTIPYDKLDSNILTRDKEFSFHIPNDISLEIQKLGNNLDKCINEILISGVIMLLSELNQGRRKIVIGTLALNEKERLANNEVVPLIVDLSNIKNFKSLINSISNNLKEVTEELFYSIDHLSKLLDLEFNSNMLSSLFDVGVSYEGLNERKYLNKYNFNVQFTFKKLNDQIKVDINYNSSFYSTNSIKKLEEIFISILNAVTRYPENDIKEIEIIPIVQKERILNNFNNGSSSFDNISIHEMFQMQVKNSMDRVVFVNNDSCVTYGFLDEKSDLLAQHLKTIGVQENSLIGIMCDRSIEFIIGILGILKFGSAYLALDTNLPNDRIGFMINDSNINTIIGQLKYLNKIDSGITLIDIDCINFIKKERVFNNSLYVENSIAYILYTSRPTDVPNGVVIEHRNVIAYCNSFLKEFHFNQNDIILQQSSQSFDTFVEEVFPMLFSGGKIVIATGDPIKNASHISDYIVKNAITIIDCSPLLINELGKVLPDKNNLRTIISRGDVLKGGYLNNFYKDTACYNTYGSTETTVCATYFKISEPVEGVIPIGKVISNYSVFILNRYEKFTPIGYFGEICIGGSGVARGYLNNVELTNEKFILNPINPSEKLYKSGDLGKFDDDGIVYLGGRLDYQVLIKEYKNELNEIESIKLEKDNEVKEYWQAELSDYKRFSFHNISDYNNNYTRKESLFIWNEDLSSRLKLYSNKEKINLETILLSAFLYSLNMFSYEEDITIGIVTNTHFHKEGSNKNLERFFNTIPFRIKCEERISIQRFLNIVEEKIINLIKINRLSLSEISNFINEESTNSNPIFDTMFNYIDNYTHNDLKDYEFHNHVVHEDSNHGLIGKGSENNDILFIVNFESFKEGIKLTTSYEEKYVTEKEVEKIIQFISRFLQLLVDQPETILTKEELIDPKESNLILNEFNNTSVDYPKDKTIHQLFEEQVEKTPENIALVFEDNQMTYRELNNKSNQIARTLREKGIKSDDVVGLMAERSFEMIIGIICILKAGGAYLPIDLEYPEDRIRFILEDSNAQILLSTTASYKEFGYHNKILYLDKVDSYSNCSDNLTTIIQSSDLAYIIYTSGTTGKPKGVMIEHRSIYNTLQSRINEYLLDGDSISIQLFSYIFDGFLTSIFTPLLSGSKSILIKSGIDIDNIGRLILDEKVTHLLAVPTMYRALLNDVVNSSKIKVVTLAGESLALDLVLQTSEKNEQIEVVNEYGPTENSVMTTILRHQEGYGKISIGKPIVNTQLYIVNNSFMIQPIDVFGELLIGGTGLARGYLNRDDLTKEKFIWWESKTGKTFDFDNKPETAIRVYRTGDLCKWLPDGNIEFLGRIDHQVKIRGFRIELLEIENALLKHENIKEIVVIARENNGDKYLCAYIVVNKPVETEELRTFLSSCLPDYMIPSYFVALEKMPLTSNGKINYKILPEPEYKSGIKFVAPSNAIEEKLSEIWSEVLNIPKEEISVIASFFSMGGHSLKAVTLFSKIQAVFEVEITLIDIFNSSTIRNLSIIIENLQLRKANKIIEELEYESLKI